MCSRGVTGLDDLHSATNEFLGHFVDVVYQYRGDGKRREGERRGESNCASFFVSYTVIFSLYLFFFYFFFFFLFSYFLLFLYFILLLLCVRAPLKNI